MSTGVMALPVPVSSKPWPESRVKKQTGADQPLSEAGKVTEHMDELDQNLENLPKPQDDLQKIKGIGRSTAEVLYRLNINHFSQLADFTPENLADLLKARLPFISVQRIERDNWIGQARALAQAQSESETFHPETNELSARPEERMEERQKQSAGEAPQVNWRELADFFVSFGYAISEGGEERLQTKAHHSQVGTSTQWEGLATEQLLKWMLTQANLPLPPEPETPVKVPLPTELPTSPPVSAEATILELTGLSVSEVKSPVLVSGQHVPGILRAKSHLSLSDPMALWLTADQLPFRVELYLVNTQTNQPELVSSYPGQLTPGNLTYEIQQDFATPNPGRYQLYLVAELLPPGEAAAHAQGPIIRVEA